MRKSILSFSLIAIFTLVLTTSCSSDDSGMTANISLQTNTGSDDFDADVIGTGGSTTKSYSWNNNLSTAEYSMDITAATGGSFQLVLKDANGLIVLDKTLNGGTEPDSYSGFSSQGEAGEWTIIVTLNEFMGDGSFSISEGN